MIFSSQGSQTLVHKLHDKQLQVFTNFLACFVKSEHLNSMPKALATLDFDDKLIPPRETYVGREADRFRAAYPQHPVRTFKYCDENDCLDHWPDLYDYCSLCVLTVDLCFSCWSHSFCRYPGHTGHVPHTCRQRCHCRARLCRVCLPWIQLWEGTPRRERNSGSWHTWCRTSCHLLPTHFNIAWHFALNGNN